MKLIKGLFFLLLPFNLMADEVQIIAKYGCYKIKSYKKASECYTRMMEENPEIKHPWVVKNFKKKTNIPSANKITSTAHKGKRKKDERPSLPKTQYQSPYQQVLSKWQAKGCPILLPVVYQATLDENIRINTLNEKCHEWEMGIAIKYGMNQNTILKKLEGKNCPRSAEVYREKDLSYFKPKEMSEIEKVSDSLCQSELNKSIFLSELKQKACSDTITIFEQRIVWLAKDSNESQYWEKECLLEINKVNNSQTTDNTKIERPLPAAKNSQKTGNKRK